MTDRDPVKTWSVLAVVAAVLAGVWLLFLRGGDAGRAPAVAGPDGEPTVALEADPPSGETTALPGGAGERGAAGEASAIRERGPATRVVRGRIDVGGSGLGEPRALLLPARPVGVSFATMFSFSNPEQLNQLEGVFERREPIAAKALAADGSFVFEDPPPGRYEVALDHAMLRLQERVTFELAERETEELGVLATQPAGSIAVIVTDQGGAPVAGAELQLKPDFDPMQFADPELLGDMVDLIRKLLPLRGETDEHGVHRFSGLRKAGQYLLSVEPKARRPVRRVVQAIDGVQQVVRVRVEPAAAFRITVCSSDGEPVARARVVVVPEARDDAELVAMFVGDEAFGKVRARTDDKGVARHDAVLPGKVDLAVRAAGYLKHTGEVTLEAGKTFERTITLVRGLSVEGVVLDQSDVPVAGARVGNVPELGKSFMGIELASMVPSELLAQRTERDGAVTDEEGRFTVHGLREGEGVHLMAVADGYAPGQLDGEVEPGSKGHVIRLARYGSVTGRVVREEDGAAVGGVEAWCSRTQFFVFEARVGKLEPASGEEGVFWLTKLPQGKHTLVVTADGRTPHRQTVEVSSAPVDLGELRLAPASAIEGVVVGEDGRPVEAASVRLAKGGMADFEMLVKMRGQEIAVTDVEGRFRLDDVPARRVKLIAEKRGFALKKSRIVRVQHGEVTKGVRIELDRGGSLHGRIVDEKGRPQSGWKLQITGMQTATVRMGETDAHGEIRVAGLAPGQYQVQAFPPNWARRLSRMSMRSSRTTLDDEMPDVGELMSVTMKDLLQTKQTVRAGKQTEFKLVYEGSDDAAIRRTRVHGSVSIGGEPIGAGFVELMELGGSPHLEFAMVKNGQYEFKGVQPGSYRVRVRSGFLSAAAFHDEIVRVPRAAEHRLDLALPGGRLAGRVVYKEDDKPAQHVVLRLSRSGQTTHYNPTHVDDVGQGMWLTDDKGRFAFDGLAAGTYLVTAQEMGFLGGKSASGRATVTLAAGERREDVVVQLGRGGRISVRVLDTNGLKPQALVRVVDASGRPANLMQASVTDAEGHAAFTGLAAGTYRVLADADDATPALSRVITLGEGGDESVEVKLRSGVAVRLIATGEPQGVRKNEIAVFTIWDPDGRLVRGGPASLDQLLAGAKKDGGMRIGSLQPGRYRVRIESPSLGLWAAEHEVPAEKETVWRVDLGKRTPERRK